MAEKVEQISGNHCSLPAVSVEEVNRILEVGKLLFAVLTPEEQEELRALLVMPLSEKHLCTTEIGNTSVT